MKLRGLFAVCLVGFLAAGVSVGEAKDDGTVNARVTDRVTDRFKRVREATGILGVNRDVQKCYDGAKERIDPTRLCMLYDIAQVRLDRAVARMFKSMGEDDPSMDNKFLSEKAFALRMKTYSDVAFGGSEAEALRFFGSAPDKIVQSLSQ